MTKRERETLLAAVERTVEALDPDDEDAAAVDLAGLYARQIDRAAATAALADRTLRDAQAGDDETLVEQVAALKAKLTERDTLDRIGARLHGLLVELQATPKARAGKGPAAPKQAGGKLAGLRVAK